MNSKYFALGYQIGVDSVPTAPPVETQEKEITVTENGTTEVTPDDGKLLSKVSVITNVEGDEGFFSIAENDAGGVTYSFSAEEGSGGGGSMEGFHKVRFFNDDRTTLLYTVFVPHGASAIYAGETPVSTEDETGIFGGFEPSAENVTADLDCYAVYALGATRLNATSWAEISQMSADGTAQNYFAVGDTKMIHLEGTVGTLEVNGDYGVYIIGFDHNSEIEGNGIHFGTFKTAVIDGIDICLIDSKYDEGLTDGIKRFNINHWVSTNNGGWGACDLRYDVLGSTDRAPSKYSSGANGKPTGVTGNDPTEACATSPVVNTLMAALPADLRAVMKPMTKYTDGKGNSSNTEAGVIATVDYLPLLAEFEIYGERKQANLYEQNKQKQYEYYAAGNSTIKYAHSSTSAAAMWWERSAFYNGASGVCVVNTNGSSGYRSALMVYGLAPIFKV